jgi:hypothetical protein
MRRPRSDWALAGLLTLCLSRAGAQVSVSVGTAGVTVGVGGVTIGVGSPSGPAWSDPIWTEPTYGSPGAPVSPGLRGGGPDQGPGYSPAADWKVRALNCPMQEASAPQAFADGTVFVSCGGSVAAVSPSGDVIWTVNDLGPAVNFTVRENGRGVLVASGNNTAYALDFATGELEGWTLLCNMWWWYLVMHSLEGHRLNPIAFDGRREAVDLPRPRWRPPHFGARFGPQP